MMARMVKYATWFFALAVSLPGVMEWVVDISVQGVGSSLALIGRCSMPKGLCVLLAQVLHPTTLTMDCWGDVPVVPLKLHL